MSPRELAVRFTDEKQYFVSEASVYRVLKAHDGQAERLRRQFKFGSVIVRNLAGICAQQMVLMR